ncbi:MAG: ATP-binding cassette subfamily B multidrug efflux pump [Parvicellaceae bacterium]|jgi:ATP-binding cassette subfamily B multidrug efflux pump
MKSLAHLNKYLWKYRWRLLVGFLFILASNVIQAILPAKVHDAIEAFSEFIKEYPNVIDKEAYFSETILTYGIYILFVYLGLSILRGIFVFLMRQTIIIVSRKIEYDLKNEIFDQYQRLSMSFYKRNNTGDLMNRISEDVTKVRMYLGPAIMYTMNLICLFVVLFIFMVQTSWELTLWTLIPLPIMSVLIYLVSSTMNKRSELVQRQQSKLTTFVQEMFSGIRVIKSYNRQHDALNNFGNESNEYKKRSLSLVLVNALFMPIIILLIGISTIITIYVGGIQTIDGEITSADIVQFVIYVNMLTWPFASIGWVTSIVQRAAASQERINEFMDEKPEIVSGELAPDKIDGTIEFKNVSFTYPDSGIQALKGIDFKVEPGKTLAIIGRTGSGKSTITDLVGRLYDATAGSILIDGHQITELNLDSLRSNIGYVPQEVFLFSESIENNIRFGIDTEVDFETIVQAAKDAHIHHNIIEFKEQFDTVLGERGITLSGGQKQRISIARALVRQPNILIFDDCLSAVDTETEEEILSNLKRIMAGKTTIIVSHRISSIQHADEIIVIDDGKIIERGRHQELLDAKGSYRDLYDKQLSEA